MAWKQFDSSRERPSEERRGGIRHPAAGEVWLWMDGRQVEGRLIDRSETGFRVAYASGELTTGQELKFAIGHQQGQARVVWNRFTSQHWESGLVIL